MKFAFYLFRWQLSTPILWAIPHYMAVYYPDLSGWIPTILANLVGGCIFFFVDKKIFKS